MNQEKQNVDMLGTDPFTDVLKVFSGCNSLGLCNAWAQQQLKKCLLCAGDPDEEDACNKKWQPKIDLLTKTYNQLCGKNSH
jgi:hypothetical protein